MKAKFSLKTLISSKKFLWIFFAVVFALAVVCVGYVIGKANSKNLQTPQTDLEIIAPDDPNSSVVSTWSGGTAAFTHGNGTINNPYLVESAENLAYISAHYDTLSGCYFKQTVNIDLSSREWSPINPNDEQYSYYYDGDNHKISHLVIDLDANFVDQAGLFACISTGYIKNLTVDSGTITYTGTVTSLNSSVFCGSVYGNVLIENCHNTGATISGYRISGGLVGYVNQTLTIKNCSNSGALNCRNEDIGGIVGYSKGTLTIENCSNTGEITGTNYVAGICGRNDGDAFIKNSHNTAKINCTGNSGGIIGFCNRNAELKIENCYNTGGVGDATSSYTRRGGILGDNYGNAVIKNCYNEGKIQATHNAGGICGLTYDNSNLTIQNCHNSGLISGIGNSGGHFGGIVGHADTPGKMIIENCYNTVEINAPSYVGGIVGRLTSGTHTIKNCYNTGTVNASGSSIGGIVGNSTAETTIFNCNNSANVSGQSNIGGILGSVVINTNTNKIENCYNTGDVTATNYDSGGIIGLAQDLANIKSCSNAGDVVCGTSGTGGDAGGIAGRVDTGIIEECYNEGNVTANAEGRAGGICANTYTAGNFLKVKNCYNKGKVESSNTNVGGIVAIGQSFLEIEDCHNEGVIKGKSAVGGILGRNTADCYIKNCYNKATISGNGGNDAAGIVGGVYYFCDVKNCYNTGAISTNKSIAGGILGYVHTNYVVNVLKCYNTGSCSASNGFAGGIVCYIRTANLNVDFCYNQGNITSTANTIGGIVGIMQPNPSSADNIKNVSISCCYSTGTMTSNATQKGSIIGWVDSNCTATLKYCYGNSDYTLRGNSGGANVTYNEINCKSLALNDMKCGSGTKPTSFADVFLSLDWLFVSGQYPTLMKTVANPEISKEFTYTGRAISPVVAADLNYATLSGDTSATNVGDYAITLTLNNTTTSLWKYDNSQAITLKWSILPAKLTKPSLTADFIFNGAVQAPTLNGFDSNSMTITGTQSATNVGTYQIVITPKANYQWADDNSANGVTLVWSIEKQSIDTNSLPSQSGTLTYNSNSQNVSWTVYDTTKFTVSGQVSGTNAGTYKAIFTPTANYQFSDGAGFKTVEWTIGKQTLTNPSLNKPNNEFTFTGTTQDATSVLQGFNSSLMTISGNTQALRAGTYIFVINIKEEHLNNYIFQNGMPFAIISWTILPFNIENGTVSVVGH